MNRPMLKFGLWLRFIIVAVGLILLQATPIPRRLRDAGQRARQAAQAGDHQAAVENLETVLAYRPWSPDDLALLANEYLALNDTSAARLSLERLVSIRPLESDEVLTLAALSLQEGQPERAAQIISDGQSRGQFDETRLRAELDVAFHARSWWMAAATLEALLAVRPQDADAQTRLALVQALVEPDAALPSLELAAKTDLQRSERLNELSAALVARQNLSPDSAYLARLGQIYVGLAEYDLADDALTQAVDLNPAYGEALAYLAFARAKLGKPALGIMHQAIALQPGSPSVRFLAGLTWKTLGRHAEARAEFERAFTLDPTNPSTAVEIANAHRAENANAYAEIWLQEALRLSGGDLRFRILLAQFYVDDNYRVAEAGLPLAQQLVIDAPDSAEAHDALGWAYFLLGGLDRASEQLNHALALDPTLARTHLHLGALMEAQANPGAAILEYRRAVELDPSGVFGALAGRALERLTGATP